MFHHSDRQPRTLLPGAGAGVQCPGASGTGGGIFDPAAAGAQMLGSAALGRWLDRLGRSEEGVRRGYGSPTFTDGNTWWGCDAERETLPAWEAVTASLASLEATMPNEGPFAIECLLAVRMARLAADRAVGRRRGDAAARTDVVGRCTALFAEYRRRWLERSRYGDLEDSYVKLKAMIC